MVKCPKCNGEWFAQVGDIHVCLTCKRRWTDCGSCDVSDDVHSGGTCVICGGISFVEVTDK